MTIREKISEARKNLPKNKGYATNVVKALKKDGVITSRHTVYRIGSGLKSEESYSELELQIAKKIIQLADDFQSAKNNV
jgi:hypothetical protein